MNETNTHEDDNLRYRDINDRHSEVQAALNKISSRQKGNQGIYSLGPQYPKVWNDNPPTNPAPASAESDPSNQPQIELLPIERIFLSLLDPNQDLSTVLDELSKLIPPNQTSQPNLNDKIRSIHKIATYLRELSSNPVNSDHYLGLVNSLNNLVEEITTVEEQSDHHITVKLL